MAFRLLRSNLLSVSVKLQFVVKFIPDFDLSMIFFRSFFGPGQNDVSTLTLNFPLLIIIEDSVVVVVVIEMATDKIGTC
jgi:hypothetical protein